LEEIVAAGARPTITQAERAAARVRVILNAAAQRVPGLKAPHAKTSRRISGHRTVPRKFIRTTIAATGAMEELRITGTFDPAEAEAALQFESAFRPIVDQLAALLASLTYTIDMRVAAVAAKALQTYAIAKGLARDGRNQQLQVRLRHLKRDLGRKGPRTKK
jgi:hypothetical protein